MTERYVVAAPEPPDDLLEIPYTDLARREQTAPVGLPMPSPMLLPFEALQPEVFERVVAEVVGWRRDNRGAHFYGRRGQKQHGLDVVELERDSRTSLYQVKRYKSVTPAQLRDAVEEYAGKPRKHGHGLAPRRFDPHRFVVVTSAPTNDDTKNIDEIDRLRRDYRGDLDIEVWGAERLSGFLRDAPGLVASVFGRPWAEAFCGAAPPAPTAQEPRPVGLVEEPVEVIGVATLVADAQAREANEPAAAAALYARVADALDDAAFPGHAALMRTRQAASARASGDVAAAFDVRYRIELDRLARGDDVRLRHDSELANDAEALGGVRLAKWRILAAACEWTEQGTNLVVVADASSDLAGSSDSDAPVLCCLVLEQAIVDGLFDFDPPRSLVAEVDDDTPTRLVAIRNAAELVSSSDPVVRARLRCAVADAALRVQSTPDEVDHAYRQLVDDAVAGRLLHAAGLAASRAAYAFAVHGDVDRAESLWRRSVLDSGEQGLYGDARNALRAIGAARADVGQFLLYGLETVAQAMPNDRRLLESRQDASVTAFEATQDDRLIDAFGAARRWLWESRLSGHLVEEMLAWRQFARVLAGGGHPAEGVECLVAAADPDPAGKAAQAVPDLIEIWSWTQSRLRGRRAAAIRVTAAQARVHPDDTLPQLVDRLLTLADGLWQTPAASPNPELEAVRAVASLGVRIPASGVDGILALAAPALERSTGVSDDIANLLLQAYWAVPDRRTDLAAGIAAMLRQPTPPHNLWRLVQNLPAGAVQPLLTTVSDLAEENNQAAAATLAAWRQTPADVQLVARRAVAALLRRPVGHDRDSHIIGTEEEVVAGLVLGLLDAGEDAPVTVEQLVPALCPPVGGVIMTRARVVDDTDDGALVSPGPNGSQANVHRPDEASRTAAAPRDEVAVAVVAKLLDLAEDRKDIAGSRLRAVLALRLLIPHVPGVAVADAARRLAELHQDPGLSGDDLAEIETNRPFSRHRYRTGAWLLCPTALVAAAEALRRTGETGHSLAGDDTFAERLVAAALPLISDADAPRARTGARTVAAVAASAPRRASYAVALLFHPDPEVRAVGAAYASVDHQLLVRLAADPAPRVRAAVASRGASLPASIRELLAHDPDAGVRHVLVHQASDESAHVVARALSSMPQLRCVEWCGQESMTRNVPRRTPSPRQTWVP